MDYSHYLCALTTAGLNSYRKTNVDPLNEIRLCLRNINIDGQTTESDTILLAEIPETGMVPYAEWLSFIMKQESLTFRIWGMDNFIEDALDSYTGVGVFCPQNQWAWNFSEEPGPLFKITPEAFLSFIDTQTAPSDFRRAVLSSVSEYSQSNFSKPVKESELNDFILSPECNIFFEYNGESLWYQVREEYVTENRKIIINEAFKNLIYETEDNYFVGEKKYGFVENQNRTATLSFKLLSAPPEKLLRPSAADDDKFKEGLSRIIDIADKINSPFKYAFTTSKSILSLSRTNITLKEVVDRCETTTEGREIIRRKAGVLKTLEDFGTDIMILSRLLACNVSDVYGGMGSWNDQHIPEEHLDEYSKVSSDFYFILKEYKAGVLYSID